MSNRKSTPKRPWIVTNDPRRFVHLTPPERITFTRRDPIRRKPGKD